ncbi:MAG: LysM peptidoglycan-binding domain-containing protein [Verrucomicrobiota bacterium]
MKKLPLVALLPLLALPQTALADTDLTVLEKRCSEQERQIRLLEEENSRLKSMLDTARRTPAPEKKEQPAIDEAPAAKPVYYTVVKGDTLSRIARRHKTNATEIAKLNGLEDTSLIRLGQKLEIPQSAAQPAPATPRAETTEPTPRNFAGTHVVKDGETFFGIARKYGLSVDTLAEANPSVNPRSIRIGQSLKLVSRETTREVAEATPAPAPERELAAEPVSNKPRIRSVRVDQEVSFGNFAAAHGMEPAKLNALNGLHLESNTVLAKGSELYVSAQP